MDEKIEITLPSELLERMDNIRKLLGYRSRGEFIAVAIRRLLDQYTVLTRELRPQT